MTVYLGVEISHKPKWLRRVAGQPSQAEGVRRRRTPSCSRILGTSVQRAAAASRAARAAAKLPGACRVADATTGHAERSPEQQHLTSLITRGTLLLAALSNGLSRLRLQTEVSLRALGARPTSSELLCCGMPTPTIPLLWPMIPAAISPTPRGRQIRLCAGHLGLTAPWTSEPLLHWPSWPQTRLHCVGA